ncbi:acyl-CoA synthetase [Myxococcus sp. K15C18031901]|uniref:acyl-CoA synthetase n=1 Tax=Myxococcus dinghuensis TaxID=2906761 RepID=UPI0020A762BD|nr:acyl-CoA synthetase [Myxococcus dinghuensis]MCP3103387.1 acyl-CoA synthetase [Myxococcus dinghuensis]
MMSGIARLADVEAIEAEGLPSDLPSSTYELLQRTARRTPDAPALSFFLSIDEHRRPETWSYSGLLSMVTRAANAFHRLGATRDTVIAYVLPNLPETHFVLWGGEATGVAMAINPLLEASTLGALLRATHTRIVVTLAPFPGTDVFPKVARALEQAPSVRDVLLVDLSDHVRGPRRFAARALQRLEAARRHGLRGARGALPAHVRVQDFGRALARERGDTLLSGRVIAPEDRSSLFCTGGTTGQPKIAVRRHRNEVANAWSASRLLGRNVGPGKNIFCGLPLFHVNAGMVTGLLPFSVGAHVVLGTPQGYRGPGVVPRFWEVVEHHRLHFFSGVPTLFASLLQVPVGDHRIDSLEFGLCGAAPLPVQVLHDFEARTGLRILEGYGLTEGTCISSVNPPEGERRHGSIGLRIPGQAMKVIQLDARGRFLRDCADDEVGLLVVSGPNVFDGYLSAEQNTGLFLDLGDGKHWLDTGDLGRRDADGFFWLTGRKKELIIRGGHNIDPADIETALYKHAAVQLAAAVGRPDVHAGELPVAYVQLKPGTSATSEALLAFVAKEIGERAAMPKAIHVVESLALTALGKIHKPSLKRLEIESALGAALRDGDIRLLQLDVLEDANRGLSVRARIADARQAPHAASILGRFAFASSVEVTP